jgi:hypothetical protein
VNEGVVLYLGAMRGPGPERVCGRECELVLKPGRYRAALGHGAADPELVDDIVIRSPAVLEGAYSSSSNTRAAGVVVLGVGLASAAGMMALGFAYGSSDSDALDELSGPTVVSGIVTGLVSLLIGVPLVLVGDDVELHVGPMR